MGEGFEIEGCHRGGFKPPAVGPFIREYLLEHGPSSAYDIWRAWVEERKRGGYKTPTYFSFYENYIWRLKKMGLIREVGKLEGRGRFCRVLLDVVVEKLDDPGWIDVQSVYRARRAGLI